MPRGGSVCATPGCPELVDRGHCDKHRRQARQASDAKRPNARARGYDRTWARTRGKYLSLHPQCESSGCNHPATDVHHLDGLGPNGPAGHKHHNLQALCHDHHAEITARQQPGGWNT